MTHTDIVNTTAEGMYPVTPYSASPGWLGIDHAAECVSSHQGNLIRRAHHRGGQDPSSSNQNPCMLIFLFISVSMGTPKVTSKQYSTAQKFRHIDPERPEEVYGGGGCLKDPSIVTPIDDLLLISGASQFYENDNNCLMAYMGTHVAMSLLAMSTSYPAAVESPTWSCKGQWSRRVRIGEKASRGWRRKPSCNPTVLPLVCVSLAKGLNFSGSRCARCKMGTVLSPVLGFVI